VDGIVGYVGSRSVHLSVRAADDINLVQPVPLRHPPGFLIPIGGTAIDPNGAGGTGGAGIRPVIFDGSSSLRRRSGSTEEEHGPRCSRQTFVYLTASVETQAPLSYGDTYVNSIAVPLLLVKSYRIGACDFDVRQTLVGTFIWDVPGPKSGLASYVGGGWESAPS